MWSNLIFSILAILTASATLPANELPLMTKGRYIVGQSGKRIKLACVNWYGAEEKDFLVGGLAYNSIQNISYHIAQFGFNCVRLPFSLELVDSDPTLTNKAVVSAEPSLLGQKAMNALDKVITGLTEQKIGIILDNHMSDADWCCNGNDGNGMWYTDKYPEQTWIALWKRIVLRYKSNPYVIGADLRNELRTTTVNGRRRTPTWGTGNKLTDWSQAATRCGDAILSVNPKLLIIVEGLNYALDLSPIAKTPIKLSIENRLVYEAHDYSWDQPSNSYTEFSKSMDNSWGYILKTNETYQAPVWLGEFGTCHSSSCVDSNWFKFIIRYLGKTEMDVDFSWWAIDGTESTGTGRTYGKEESYGILDKSWQKPAYSPLLEALQGLMG